MMRDASFVPRGLSISRIQIRIAVELANLVGNSKIFTD
jgi:hypothetical protein